MVTGIMIFIFLNKIYRYITVKTQLVPFFFYGKKQLKLIDIYAYICFNITSICFNISNCSSIYYRQFILAGYLPKLVLRFFIKIDKNQNLGPRVDVFEILILSLYSFGNEAVNGEDGKSKPTFPEKALQYSA